jgi:hypothetical protein
MRTVFLQQQVVDKAGWEKLQSEKLTILNEQILNYKSPRETMKKKPAGTG